MRRIRRVPAALLLAFALVVAGCLAPTGPTPDGDDGDGNGGVQVPADWALRALNNDEDHDHFDVQQHRNRSTPNFELVGWDPLITDYHGSTSGGHLCGEVSTTGDRKFAVTHGFSNDIAFVVADVTDPANPVKVGELALPNVHTYDVAIMDDGSYVAVATSLEEEQPDEEANGTASPTAPGEAPAPSTIEAVWTDRCGDEHESVLQLSQHEQVPYQAGVVLVSLADPAQPEVVDYRSQPGIGVHSIFATVVDGTRFILASTTNLAHTASYFTFFTVEEAPALGGRLVEYGVYEAQYPPGGESDVALVNGHVDGWIHTHPGTDDTLAYLANWNGGLVIVRLDGPGQLTTVGTWTDHEPGSDANLAFAGTTGQIHETLPMAEMWGDRHITFIGQEVGAPPEGRPTGQVIMMDTTDPSDPTPVARWTLPVDVTWGQVGTEFLLFSTHYVTVVDRTLFVSLYHGGVWAVGTEPVANTTELPTLGVFLPTEVSPAPPGDLAGSYSWTPTVLDVLSNGDADGTLTLFDATSGVYQVRFDPAFEGVPVPEPWTGDSWIEADG